MRTILRPLTVAVLFGACATPASLSAATRQDADTTARRAHEAYVVAINTNNPDSILALLTEDVVYLAPHEPVLVGKAAVRPWVEGYLKVFKTHWEKASLEVVVAGEWAFERYSYKSTDTPQGGGGIVVDIGKGLLIYHHDADGKWRVARDAWSTDLPLPMK